MNVLHLSSAQSYHYQHHLPPLNRVSVLLNVTDHAAWHVIRSFSWALEVSGAFQPVIVVELEQGKVIASVAVKHLNHSFAATLQLWSTQRLGTISGRTYSGSAQGPRVSQTL
jgi:hypothetical protein